MTAPGTGGPAEDAQVRDDEAIKTLRRIDLWVCDECLARVGFECHTPGCAFWMHDVPTVDTAAALRAALDLSAAAGSEDEGVEMLWRLILHPFLQAHRDDDHGHWTYLRQADLSGPAMAAARAVLAALPALSAAAGSEDGGEALRREVERLRTVLGTVLMAFTEKGHPGMPCLRTGWMPVGLVESWRTALSAAAPVEEVRPARLERLRELDEADAHPRE